MKKAYQIQQELDELKSKVSAIVSLAQKEDRELTQDEQKFVDDALGREDDGSDGKVEQLRDQVVKAMKIEKVQRDSLITNEDKARIDWMRANDPLSSGQPQKASRSLSGGISTFRDSSGREIRAYAPGQRMGNGLASASMVGELVQASVIGLKSWHSDEVRAAMSTGSNPGGGFLLTPQMWNGLIDLARAKSQLVQAGCSFVDMETAQLQIAAVAGDPTFIEKAENEPFPGTSVTLRQVNLVARTIGNIVTLSRELAADAPNAAEMIGDVLARALAVAIDARALTGNASANFLGLLENEDVDVTGTDNVGAIEWADLHKAATAIRVRNHEPSAAIMHPKAYGALVTTFGEDFWTSAPPSLQGVQMLPTTSCTEAKAIVGDFRYALFGIRQQPLLEMSINADGAFEKHQLKLKLTWRGDFVATDLTAFHRLEGITYAG